MCGLVYINRKDGRPAYKAVLKRYRKQKTRGTQGFGYVAIKDGEVVSYRRSPTEHEIIKHLEKETANEILFHHRMPTSTPNIEEAAHPLLIEDKLLKHQYFWAHNGVIRTPGELKDKHEKLGFVYTTEMAEGLFSRVTGRFYGDGKKTKFNDSESIAIEASLALDGLKQTIDTEGTVAVIGLQLEGKKVIDRLFFRNIGNPLCFFESKEMIELTSTGQGNAVQPTNVFRLKKSGGYEAVKPIVLSPLVNAISSHNWNRTWDKNTQKFVEKNDPTVMQLPAGHPMGFHSRTNIPEDWDLDMPLGDQAGADFRKLDEISKDIDDMVNKAGRHKDLSTMSESDLWDEWYDTETAEENLEAKLQDVEFALEDSMYSVEDISDKIMNESVKLNEKLQTIKEYQGRLSTELTKRESLRADPIDADVKEKLSK